jgi:hypothetical protein
MAVQTHSVGARLTRKHSRINALQFSDREYSRIMKGTNALQDPS